MVQKINVTNGTSEISEDLRNQLVEKINEGLELGKNNSDYYPLTLEVIKAVLEHSVI